MNSIARFNFQADPTSIHGVGGGSGGGEVEDVLRRLGSLETAVSAIKIEVGAIAVVLPHLATKEDVALVKANVSAIMAQLPHLATKADVSDVKASIIQWMVSTTIAAAAVAFTIAKFVH